MVFMRLIVLIICVTETVARSYAWAVPDRAIEPVLAEQWQRSAAVLLANEDQQADPVTRLLIGYVALASNHTNEAMAMFSSVQDIEDLRSWRKWTEQLAGANVGNRMAALLSIDAEARLGEVTVATKSMQTLLDKEPGFALAYDLAGALDILHDDKASAREAFKTATDLDAHLADAWISRGSLEAIARTPLDVPQLGNVRSADILGFFDKALVLDPTSAPARLGRGVILYGLGRFPEAAEAFADAERVAPWLGLASYNGMQSELTALRRYVLQSSSRQVSSPGMTLQMQFTQQSQVLGDRASESATLLANTISRSGNSTTQFDPKLLDTANVSQLQTLVATYGLQTIELANAARIDANSADLFRRNTQIQNGVGTLSILRNVWEATATLSVAAELGDFEKNAAVGAIRVLSTFLDSKLNDEQWAFSIGISRATSVATAAVKGENLGRALQTQPLGEIATMLNAILHEQSNQINTQFGDAMAVAQTARHNMWVSQQLSSWNNGGTRLSTVSPNTVLAPSNYSQDAASQLAFINAVSQSVRGGSVVLVPRDRTQSFLLQQELNRRGVGTQTAQTPQAGIDLAKFAGSSWVIGVDGRWADPPNLQTSRLPLKSPDTLPGWSGGGPPPPPIGRSGASLPPSPPTSTSLPPTTTPIVAAAGLTNWAGFQRFTPPPSPTTPGGVRTFTDTFIDDGRWPVHVPLTLCLPVVRSGQ